MEPASAMRWKDYKLIQWHEPTLLNMEKQIELYNLILDPGEKNDLSQVEPEIAILMRNKLKNWIIEVDANMPIINKAKVVDFKN